MPIYAENLTNADRYDYSILLTTAFKIVAVALVDLVF